MAKNKEWENYVRALTDNELEDLIELSERGITDAGQADMKEVLNNLCQLRNKLCLEHMRRNEENDHVF